MHLRSLSLRNYRVYRSVDLEFPDGLIGIYGSNGSGKSTIIESIRFALYGDSRTDKWELRSAGVGDDVRVELVFEHEGNTYDVRRRLKGRNLTPEVEVFLNGQLAAQSVREANAYLARVLGMDQRAFLASVCAQQKELTAFATQRQFVYSHRWRVGDLVIWDNRCTMHRGMEFDDQRFARDMRRATVSDVAPTCEQMGLAVAAE